MFESDVREVRKFQETLKNNAMMSRDFNEWYTGFTLNQAQKGNGVPRDATTIKLQDIKFINRYMDSINTNKNMELK